MLAVVLVLTLLVPVVYARNITLNFKDANIRAFIEFVATFSGKNFLIDNRVKGKVTIISPSPVNDKEAYAIFLSVLEVNGFVAVKSGSIIKIVPRAEGKQKPLPVVSGNGGKAGDAMVTEVIRLHYAVASQLMAILRPLIPPNSNLVAYARGNILLITDSAANIQRIRAVVKRLDVAPELDSGRLQVRYLKYANAGDVAKVLNSLVGGQSAAKVSGNKPLFSGQVKIVADDATNALLITAGPEDISAVGSIIDKLDVRRRQVLVEALIVEVSGNAAQRFGVEWMAAGGVGAGVQNFKNIKPIGAALAANATAATPAGIATTLAGAAPTGITLGVVNKALSIGALVHAMESDNNANVLSTPNLLTMDNEEAEIIVGQNVPFVTGQNVTQGGTANPFQTIERKDVGLTLRITPQISAGDSVRLKIYQEISSVVPAATNTSGSSDIVTNKRSIKTVVLANDDQMIVLGGLMRDDNTATVQRVPCIGAMPLIGEAFKFTENTKTKTNLMVFLKPHIIKSANKIDAITNRKYNDIRGLYETPVKGGTILFPHEPQRLPDQLKSNPPPSAIVPGTEKHNVETAPVTAP